MSTRRRRLSILLIGLTSGVLILLGLGSQSGRPKVDLVFIGYTNRFAAKNSAFFGSVPQNFRPWPDAVFIATNSGANPVHTLGWPSGLLKPRESCLVFQSVGVNGEPFRAQLSYYERGWRDRLSDRLATKANPLGVKLAMLIRPKPQLIQVHSEWIGLPPWNPTEPDQDLYARPWIGK